MHKPLTVDTLPQESTPKLTTLRRRVCNGKARFTQTYANWCSSYAPGDYIAFDVTWDGNVVGSNYFDDYSVQARITSETKPGNLLLMLSVRDGEYQFVKTWEDGTLTDACTGAPVDPEGVELVGVAVCEREAMSAAQIDLERSVEVRCA